MQQRRRFKDREKESTVVILRYDTILSPPVSNVRTGNRTLFYYAYHFRFLILQAQVHWVSNDLAVTAGLFNCSTLLFMLWIFHIGNLRGHTEIFVAGIARWYTTGLRDGWSGVRAPAGTGNFSLHHRLQTGSGAHPASYPMGIRGFFPWG
jgi:hypothetical protein